MDKDRIKGAVDQAKGKVKSAVGKAVGDQKLQVEGEAETRGPVISVTREALRDVECILCGLYVVGRQCDTRRPAQRGTQ